MTYKAWALSLILTLSSCSHYIYEGRIKAKGVDGGINEHILYWNTTEYLFGVFDTASDMKLRVCGGSFIYSYDDDSGKIIFQGDPAHMSTLRGLRTRGDICGAIIGYEIIDLIPEGNVKVAVYCNPAHKKKRLVKPKMLKAQRRPYVFNVTKSKMAEDYFVCPEDKKELEELQKGVAEEPKKS